MTTASKTKDTSTTSTPDSDLARQMAVSVLTRITLLADGLCFMWDSHAEALEELEQTRDVLTSGPGAKGARFMKKMSPTEFVLYLKSIGAVALHTGTSLDDLLEDIRTVAALEEEGITDIDSACTVVYESPLEMLVRDGWHALDKPGKPEEFLILLCTGGPAVRLRGCLNSNGYVSDAWMEYQDWFTPWTRLTHPEVPGKTQGEIDDAMKLYAENLLGDL